MVLRIQQSKQSIEDATSDAGRLAAIAVIHWYKTSVIKTLTQQKTSNYKIDQGRNTFAQQGLNLY